MPDIEKIPRRFLQPFLACIARIKSQEEPVPIAELIDIAGIDGSHGHQRRMLLDALRAADGIWQGGSTARPVFGHGTPPPPQSVVKAAIVHELPPATIAKAMLECISFIQEVSKAFPGMYASSLDLRELCGNNQRLWEYVREELRRAPGFHTKCKGSSLWRYDEEEAK